MGRNGASSSGAGPGGIDSLGMPGELEFSNIWIANTPDGTVSKIDASTRAVVTTVTGLQGPYTYSDMTGAGLSLVTNPPPA